MGAIFNVRIFMSTVQEMKDRWGLPQETGGLSPMIPLRILNTQITVKSLKKPRNNIPKNQ